MQYFILKFHSLMLKLNKVCFQKKFLTSKNNSLAELQAIASTNIKF